jgi:HEPN domain-containing protein
MKREEIKNSAQSYYYFAVQDLAAARILLASNEIDIQLIMFHLQQCIEKLLKAMLSNRRVEISRTHDIERLITLCRENGENLPDYVEELIDLSLFAVEGRYALIHDDVCDAGKFLRAAENFRDFTERLLDAERK